MNWDYHLQPHVERELSKLDQQTRAAVFAALDALMPAMDGPHQPPPGTKVLRHVKPTTWRLRIGDWRVLFRPDASAKVVVVHST
jgi:mRNA-degrading endonuclease RelE of RelBE toxin-antitoxin system